MDRDSLSLPIASSQWYTSTLTPPTEKEPTPLVASPISTPVFELTEEVKPLRPLRSEVEREKRLSRPTSIIAVSNTNIRGNNTSDTISLSGESSNRNSIGK